MTSAAAIPTVTLNDENTIPVIGLGVGELSESETERAVSTALEAGYRLIDTAAAYGNEEAVGRAVAASGVRRDELFITTKLATEDQGYQASQDACKASVERLGLDYVDLNQIELHPLLNQAELRAVNAEYGIVTEAYGPLGVGRLLDNPTIATVAEARGKTPAQVLIRWSIQLGNVVIPRSANPERIKSNLAVFDFELSDDEMATLNGLDDGTRFRPNPDEYTGT